MLIDRSHGLRLLGLLSLPASVVCLLASKSMTGLLSTTSAMGFVWFFLALGRSRGNSRLVLIIVFLQFVALLLLALGEFLVPLLEALGKDATLTGRVPLWALVDEMISRKIAVGYGYGAFWTPGNVDAWRIWEAIGWQAPHSHNGYREVLLGLGLVGFLTLAIVLVRAVWQGGRALLHAALGGLALAQRLHRDVPGDEPHRGDLPGAERSLLDALHRRRPDDIAALSRAGDGCRRWLTGARLSGRFSWPPAPA
jgi:O-antigen ligase